MLANIALSNPGASSADLAAIFLERTGREMNPRTVRRDMMELKKEWIKQSKDDITQLRAVELKRLDILEQEAWNAWRLSMQPAEKVVVERLRKALDEVARMQAAGELAEQLASMNEYVTEEVLEQIILDAIKASLDSGEDSETFVNKITVTTQGQVGDPRFLAQIHELQKERRKILGVYAPELLNVNVNKRIQVQGYAGGWSPDSWKEDDIIDGDTVDNNVEDAELEEDDNELLLGDGS